ncbi:cobalt-precorrin-6A reductase [uncultured Roseovarius sp.]|uniref:cobalt-precorrin-6A reductase n=1 Tax=uncultured Roseovarius sp. TaxID=293344 RepID=UPI00261F82D2|nr:cobalt-precorrin-6A reductase [uncultured Roseovarius sp.]
MTLLLLAGTAEARYLAQVLASERRAAIASLAGATRRPRPLELPTRIGGFGGESGFVRYLVEAGITAVLDATHPFASRISERTARICATKNVPYCQLLRPEWAPIAEDHWTLLTAEEDAAAHIPKGMTVFLATGRQGVTRFANLTGRHLICRVVDLPDEAFPFENGEYLLGRPPFTIEAERGLFERLGVDWLVVKNAGGRDSESKLAAARTLGLPVAMIARPPQPIAMRVETVSEALDWVRGL